MFIISSHDAHAYRPVKPKFFIGREEAHQLIQQQGKMQFNVYYLECGDIHFHLTISFVDAAGCRRYSATTSSINDNNNQCGCVQKLNAGGGAS